MKIELLQHVPFEGPGLIAAWAEASRHQLHPIEVYRGEPFLAPDEVDLLILMGGPMSVTEETVHPWLRPEKAHLRDVLHAGIPTLGICLGAQMLAEALGAVVIENPEKEIGWFPVRRVPPGTPSPVHDIFPPSLEVFHWHGETFTLPDGARHLARSPACENQAFVYKERVVALQFHLEMTPVHIASLIENSAPDLAGPGPWTQDPETMRQTPIPPENQRVLFEILDYLAGRS